MVAGRQTRHDPYRSRYFNRQRLHADKAYDRPDLRKWLRDKRMGARIARKGIENEEWFCYLLGELTECAVAGLRRHGFEGASAGPA